MLLLIYRIKFFKVLLRSRKNLLQFFLRQGCSQGKKKGTCFLLLFLFISSTPGKHCLGKHFSPDTSPTLISLITRKLQTAQPTYYGLAYILATNPNALAKRSCGLLICWPYCCLCRLFGWPVCREGFLSCFCIQRAYYNVELDSIQSTEAFFFPGVPSLWFRSPAVAACPPWGANCSAGKLIPQ